MGVRGTELFDEVDARLSEIKRLFTQFAGEAPAAASESPAGSFGRLQLARMILWGRSLLEREVAKDLFADPAFNRDRGPVNVFAARLHWEY